MPPAAGVRRMPGLRACLRQLTITRRPLRERTRRRGWAQVKRIRRALEINQVMATMPLIGIGCIPQQFVPMLLEVGVGGKRKRDSTAITRRSVWMPIRSPYSDRYDAHMTIR